MVGRTQGGREILDKGDVEILQLLCQSLGERSANKQTGYLTPGLGRDDVREEQDMAVRIEESRIFGNGGNSAARTVAWR